jgi:hypothetical protein
MSSKMVKGAHRRATRERIKITWEDAEGTERVRYKLGPPLEGAQSLKDFARVHMREPSQLGAAAREWLRRKAARRA